MKINNYKITTNTWERLGTDKERVLDQTAGFQSEEDESESFQIKRRVRKFYGYK